MSNVKVLPGGSWNRLSVANCTATSLAPAALVASSKSLAVTRAWTVVVDPPAATTRRLPGRVQAFFVNLRAFEFLGGAQTESTFAAADSAAK